MLAIMKNPTRVQNEANEFNSNMVQCEKPDLIKTPYSPNSCGISWQNMARQVDKPKLIDVENAKINKLILYVSI